MTDFEVSSDNKALLKAVDFLKIRFPVSSIEKATGYSAGNISKYLNGKLAPSAKFLQKFQESFNIDLKDFTDDPAEVEMNDNKVVVMNPHQKQDDEAVNYVYHNKERLLKSHTGYQMLYRIIKMEVEMEFMKQHPEK